ncbi:TetR/AcrR family transcriptional regulator [Albimonas sp. CAU 1670]|uniref:TetR/AcrR family transcriptional regulator n=1 Tax=Albimonas sp. CAU 1670 TaxID=3032599 RepID=UPI0023DCA412|nr:TetR/AcrR family transcriptional regulator [Albimonas sp. CAU 1670]MDF2235235.1 TetR/AcrR family transcriptional regulator [Albimonas sp. CAU 1670]
MSATGSGGGARARAKRESLSRILVAASARLRREGLEGAAIAPVMKEAGLTHGAFYAHFPDKDALAVAAFRQAFATERERWIGRAKDRSWPARARRLAARYLTRAHRDDPGAGCAFAALATDAARAPEPFREAYAQELRATLAAIRGRDSEAPEDPMRPPPLDHAAAMLALCVGGLSLARAVNDPELSERLLAACRDAAERLAAAEAAALDQAGPQTEPDPGRG